MMPSRAIFVRSCISLMRGTPMRSTRWCSNCGRAATR
jgi:hypothetical protein